MGISTSDILDVFNKDVFTTKGYYAGKVNDCEIDLARYKVRALIVQAAGDSIFSKLTGGKKGVIIPYSMVQAIGDIVIIKHVEKAEAPEVTETTPEA
jgi:sporulation protein YlmC with PRC-barrel domain